MYFSFFIFLFLDELSFLFFFVLVFCFFFFFKQKTAYEIGVRLVGSEMCIRDSRQAVLGVFRQLRQLAGGLFGLLLLHGLLACRAQPLDLRLLFGQNVQQGVHVPLILEVALLLLAAVVLHHQIGHGLSLIHI